MRPIAHEGDTDKGVHCHRDFGEVRLPGDGVGCSVDVFVLNHFAEELRGEDGKGEEEDEDDGEDAGQGGQSDAEVGDEGRQGLSSSEDFDDANEPDRPENGTDARVDDGPEHESDDGRCCDEEVEFVPLRRDVNGERLSEDFAKRFEAEENGENILKRFQNLAVHVRRGENLNAEKQKVGNGDNVARENEPRSAYNVAELLLHVAVCRRTI